MYVNRGTIKEIVVFVGTKFSSPPCCVGEMALGQGGGTCWFIRYTCESRNLREGYLYSLKEYLNREK